MNVEQQIAKQLCANCNTAKGNSYANTVLQNGIPMAPQENAPNTVDYTGWYVAAALLLYIAFND